MQHQMKCVFTREMCNCFPLKLPTQHTTCVYVLMCVYMTSASLESKNQVINRDHHSGSVCAIAKIVL